MANETARIPLSGSTQGMGIKLVATATPGTLLHTTGVSATIQDEIRLYFFNAHTVDVVVTVEWGDATAPDHQIIQTVPFKTGLVLAVPGDLILLGNGTVALTVQAFASVANVVIAYGSVYRVTP